MSDLTLRYDDPQLGARLQAFAAGHPGARFKQFVRLNLETMVVSARSKGN